MVELVLTEEEKAAPLWSDLDDVVLGKLVRKHIDFLTDASAQLDHTTELAGAMVLCNRAVEEHVDSMTLELEGLTQDGRDFGDWKIVVTRITPMKDIT